MNRLINYLIRKRLTGILTKGDIGKNKKMSGNIWNLAGNIAEYFSEKDSAEWEYNKEKLYFRLLEGLKNEVFN